MAASVIKKGRKALLAKKVGMTQVFQEDGGCVPVTVLEVGPCTVLQVKSQDGPDGYPSIQVGFDEARKEPVRPQVGHFKKAGVRPKRLVREIPPVGVADIFRVPLQSRASGSVEFDGFEPGVTLLERKLPRSKLYSRTVTAVPGGTGGTGGTGGEGGTGAEGGGEAAAGTVASAETAGAGCPGSIRIKDSSGAVLESHAIPAGSSIEVAPGQTVADGDVLAYVPPGENVPEAVTPGVQIGVTLFRGTAKVDVRGVTKGRGYQGCIRRHHFNAGDKSHGSKNVREPGSTGMNQSPGRVLKGKRMPGHMGVQWRKTRALKVVGIDELNNLMLVKGAVPGPNGGYVVVQESLSSRRASEVSSKG